MRVVGAIALVSQAYPPYIHMIRVSISTTSATAAPASGRSARTAVSCVIVKTKTRSKKSSSVLTRTASSGVDRRCRRLGLLSLQRRPSSTSSSSSGLTSTSRALEPSDGPTMPRVSIRSISRPALANPTRSLRCSIEVEPNCEVTTSSIACSSSSRSSPMSSSIPLLARARAARATSGRNSGSRWSLQNRTTSAISASLTQAPCTRIGLDAPIGRNSASPRPISFSAPGWSRMTRESASDDVANESRAGTFALIRPVTTSTDGRCVASTRWMPAARASWVIRTTESSTSRGATIIRSASSSTSRPAGTGTAGSPGRCPAAP